MTPERARRLAAERERERESMAEHLALAGAVAQRAGLPLHDQTRRLAADLVARLGFEHVAIGMLGSSRDLRLVGSFSQSERFADDGAGEAVDLLPFLNDAIASPGLVRWGPPGPGRCVRPPRRAGVHYAAGIPLRHEGALIGALVTTDIVPRRWSPADERALENLAAIAGAVLGASAAAAARVDSLRPALPASTSAASARTDTTASAAAEPDLGGNDHDAFFGLVSHELRTPLAAVMGHLEMLGDDSISMSDGQRLLLSRAADQTRHLCRLVEDLFFLGDAGSGRVDLVWQETPLAPLLVRLVGALAGTTGYVAPDAPLPASMCRVQTDLASVRTDARLLERALFHLAADLVDQATCALVVESRAEGTELVVRMTASAAADPPALPRAHGPDLLTSRFRTAIVRACLSLLGGRLQIAGPAAAPLVEIRIPGAVERRPQAASARAHEDRRSMRPARVLGSTRPDAAGVRPLRARELGVAQAGQTVR